MKKKPNSIRVSLTHVSRNGYDFVLGERLPGKFHQIVPEYLRVSVPGTQFSVAVLRNVVAGLPVGGGQPPESDRGSAHYHGATEQS